MQVLDIVADQTSLLTILASPHPLNKKKKTKSISTSPSDQSKYLNIPVFGGLSGKLS